MAIREPRPYSTWHLMSPLVGAGEVILSERASVALIGEILTPYVEIEKIGRARFAGASAERNALWREFRNYMRQALSNFSAAQSVPNRSACLLYYYALLNFAKAELLDTHSADIVNKRLGHGLSFSPTAGRTVSGDVLTITNGVFPMLYERRTGYSLKLGERLSIKRLLTQIPEIESQAEIVSGAGGRSSGLYQMLAFDDVAGWSLICVVGQGVSGGPRDVSARLLDRHYEEVQPPRDWRDNFALSRQFVVPIRFYESRVKVPLPQSGTLPTALIRLAKESIGDILGPPTSQDVDAWLSPSLYKTRMFPMPPALARYAIMFYASSLVRYKPQMFDAQLFPDQAYLFDAIARELALPMFQDVLSAIEGRVTLFRASGWMRL